MPDYFSNNLIIRDIKKVFLFIRITLCTNQIFHCIIECHTMGDDRIIAVECYNVTLPNANGSTGCTTIILPTGISGSILPLTTLYTPLPMIFGMFNGRSTANTAAISRVLSVLHRIWKRYSSVLFSYCQSYRLLPDVYCCLNEAVLSMQNVHMKRYPSKRGPVLVNQVSFL